MIVHHFINYKNSKLHFTRQGAENKILLCFHGYGWNCYNFDFIMPDLIRAYTVYSFDLFAHGESEWNEGREFSAEDFRNIFVHFFESENIHSFSAMGYSLGGRWATSIVNAFDNRVQNLFLVAADGLQKGTIIDILSKIKESNKIIEYIIHHPKIIHHGLKMGYFAGLINKESLNFYIGKNDTKEKRELIMKRIRLCKNLFISPKLLLQKIRNNNINVHLFYGTRDLVMPPLLTVRLTKNLGKAILHKIEDDHMLIIKPPFLSALKEVLELENPKE